MTDLIARLRRMRPVVEMHLLDEAADALEAAQAENERLQYEAIGWTWAEACGQLDLGLDPREYDIANLAERAKTELAATGDLDRR